MSVAVVEAGHLPRSSAAKKTPCGSPIR
jgi:hypothetical protein